MSNSKLAGQLLGGSLFNIVWHRGDAIGVALSHKPFCAGSRGKGPTRKPEGPVGFTGEALEGEWVLKTRYSKSQVKQLRAQRRGNSL